MASLSPHPDLPLDPSFTPSNPSLDPSLDPPPGQMATAATSSSTSPPSIPPGVTEILSKFSSFVTTRLDSSNFLIWKAQVSNILRGKHLMGYLEGTKPCPPPEITDPNGSTTPNSEYDVWVELDALLLSCLTSTFSQTTLNHMYHHSKTSDLWSELHSAYSSISIDHIHDLKHKLANVRKDSTMEVYLGLIRDYSDRLAAAGSPLSAIDLVFTTLDNLPPEYDQFKTSIRTRDTPITFTALVPKLSSHELVLARAQLPPPKDITTSLVATHATTSNGNRNSPHFNRGGSQSNKPSGSYRSQQFSKGGNRNGTNFWRGGNRGNGFVRYENYNGEPCPYCNRTNHPSYACHFRPNSNLQRQAHMATSNSPNSWHLDSGANNHITRDMSNMTMAHPYPGYDSVAVGNGSYLPIHHSGDGLLPTPRYAYQSDFAQGPM